MIKCNFCNRLIKDKSRRKICPCFKPGIIYCDQYCQKRDWKEGGHKQECNFRFRKHQKEGKGPDSDYKKKVDADRHQSSKHSNLDHIENEIMESEGVNGQQQSVIVDEESIYQQNQKDQRSKSDHRKNKEPQLQGRDGKGRFMCLGETSTKKDQQTVSAKNYSDFKIVTTRLQSIMGVIYVKIY